MLWLLIEWNLGVWARGNLCSRQVFDLAGTGDQDSRVCCGMLFLLCLDAVSMFYEGELCLSSTDATPFREGGRKGMCDYSARRKPWGRQACTSGGGIGNITSVTACKYYLHSSCFLFFLCCNGMVLFAAAHYFYIQVLAQEQWKMALHFSLCTIKWFAAHSLAQLWSYVKDVLSPSLLRSLG